MSRNPEKYAIQLDKKGEFPRGIRLGANTRAWMDEQFQEWLSSREDA
ncbi:MAG: AlpA family phage regulatory protein [Geoalkalibacter sp.]